MLDDIRTAVSRVFTEIELEYDTKHEAFNDSHTLATIIASEVLKAITIQTPQQPKKPPREPRRRRAEDKQEPAPAPEPQGDGSRGITKTFPAGELA